MSDLMLHVTGLSKRFGGLRVTNDLSLDIRHGEFHALIGPNGAGKTTLINQLHGTLLPDAGNILLDGIDITRYPTHRRAACGLARSFQISSVIPEFTALENVALAIQARSGHSFRFWRPTRSDSSLQTPAREALTMAGLEARANTVTTSLSHGERRQLEIAIALAMQPKIMLLDEPMAGMGPNECQRLVSLLKQLKGEYTIVMVEHDMDAVFALADRLSVLVAGQVIACGTPDAIRSNATVQAAYLGHSDSRS